MNKRIPDVGVTIIVKMIEPSDLSKMKKEEKVIVNRVRLVSRLVEFEIKNSEDPETMAIIRKAMKEMKVKEEKNHRVLMGPEMTVGEVLKVFDDLSSLPKNTFATAGNY